MRVIVAVLSLIFATTLASSQAEPRSVTAAKSPIALSRTERVGPLLSEQSLIELRGTLTVSLGPAVTYPITVKLQGADLYRSELETPTGKIVRIVNRGRGVQVAADGKARSLSASNTFATASIVLPSQLLATHRVSPKFDLDQDEKGVISTNIARLDRARDPVAKFSIKKFYLNAEGERVDVIEYERYAENAGNKQQVRVEYRDYKSLGGITVPTRQITIVDGRVYSELVITDARELPPSEATGFAIPEVKNDR